MQITVVETALRMGASVLLGGAIGYERERTGRPAGLRTHLLVSLASATFMLVSTQFVYRQHYGKDDLVSVDTSRIAASVVSGVGFLGAGAILRTGLNVQGLTTAASLWLVSSVGLAAGGGMYLEATSATFITLFALVTLRRIEGHQWRLLQRRMLVVLQGCTDDGNAVLTKLKSLGVNITGVDYDRDVAADRFTLQMDARFANSLALDQVLRELETLPGVRHVSVKRPN